MSINPSIYEINARVFVKRYSEDASLNDVPDEYWDELSKKKFEYVWLLGVWKICESVIEKYCFEEELVRSYNKALKGWRRRDVIGSPFSIDYYELNSQLGDMQTLIELKKKLNDRGLKLILDLSPNHFGADSKLIRENPEIFLEVDKSLYVNDSHTYFKPYEDFERYFAHGRDPFFPAWQDTIQVNFFSNQAREYFKKILTEIINYCDGVRCDMAMLALNNIFKNTWAGVLEKKGWEQPEEEFWSEIISYIKNNNKDFIFIAEAYWDLEWDLQQLGFDYSYDKKLTDRLRYETSREIHDHLLAENEYQKKSLRFIENHDEDRAITAFGKEKSKAASVIISTIQGMRFYHNGQFEGKKIRLPLQLGREPEEPVIQGIKNFYKKLIDITTHDIFKNGEWNLLEPIPSWEGNNSYTNILAWEWRLKNNRRIILVNYSDILSTCRLKFDVTGLPDDFQIIDLLNDQEYYRTTEEVFHMGLYVELKPWQSHIFSI